MSGQFRNYPKGAGDRSRTRDILITSEALYQLSYTGAAMRPEVIVPGHPTWVETFTGC